MQETESRQDHELRGDVYFAYVVLLPTPTSSGVAWGAGFQAQRIPLERRGRFKLVGIDLWGAAGARAGELASFGGGLAVLETLLDLGLVSPQHRAGIGLAPLSAQATYSARREDWGGVATTTLGAGRSRAYYRFQWASGPAAEVGAVMPLYWATKHEYLGTGSDEAYEPVRGRTSFVRNINYDPKTESFKSYDGPPPLHFYAGIAF